MDPEETNEEPAAPPEPIQPQELAGARESEPRAPSEPPPAPPETPTPEPAPAEGEARSGRPAGEEPHSESVPPAAPAGETAPPPAPEPESPPSETVPVERTDRTPDTSTIQPSVGREAKMRKLERRLERMLAVARKRGVITNRDIRESLQVSKATASRYARILERRGFVKKFGRTRAARYEVIN